MPVRISHVLAGHDTRALVFISMGRPNDMRNASKTSSFQESNQAFLLASRRLIFPAHLHFGSEMEASQHLEINGHARRPPGGCETDPAQGGSDAVSSVMFCERVQTCMAVHKFTFIVVFQKGSVQEYVFFTK